MNSGPKITVGGEKPDTLKQLLAKLFWKQPELSGKAEDFLSYVREWGRSETPFRVSQWENYCLRSGLSQSQYHNILRRLKNAGLIRKAYNKSVRDHEIFLDDGFSKQLHDYMNVWDDFLAG